MSTTREQYFVISQFTKTKFVAYRDWAQRFVKCHHKLSLGKLESTEFGQAVVVNKVSVGGFS